jgi:hypothetical protein
LVVRDYNADEKIDWHDYYLEALTPVQTVSIKLGNILFTPISALLHTVWFVVPRSRPRPTRRRPSTPRPTGEAHDGDPHPPRTPINGGHKNRRRIYG